MILLTGITNTGSTSFVHVHWQVITKFV